MNVNLASGWSTLWSAISGAIGTQVTGLLTIIGVIIVVLAVGKWIFDKRRGGRVTEGTDRILWALVAGALLAAPQVIIPIFLNVLDAIINAILAVANTGH